MTHRLHVPYRPRSELWFASVPLSGGQAGHPGLLGLGICRRSVCGEFIFTSGVLETGRRQPGAISLYEKHGYQHTANYGQYVGVANSVCFAKSLA
jgi:hypothetical protein